MFIDISRTISPHSVVFPGDAKLRFVQLSEVNSESHFGKIGIEAFSGHVMSHVDAPCHVFADGKTLDDYHVGDFVFDAVVHEVNGDVIDQATVEQIANPTGKAVLFKTRGSDIGETEPFAANFVYVTSSGADALIETGVTAVGIDYLSIDSIEDHVAHHKLMRHDILIFECLQLRDVTPGNYRLFAFPLKIQGGDGSPVRAVLETV